MKYLPTKFKLDWCYSFWVLRTKRAQTDRQKQTDHNNPLLSSSIKNKTKVFFMLIPMNFTQDI